MLAQVNVDRTIEEKIIKNYYICILIIINYIMYLYTKCYIYIYIDIYLLYIINIKYTSLYIRLILIIVKYFFSSFYI